jgi:hypothetical protein
MEGRKKTLGVVAVSARDRCQRTDIGDHAWSGEVVPEILTRSGMVLRRLDTITPSGPLHMKDTILRNGAVSEVTY